MLYALGDPRSLVVLLVAFVLAVTVSGWVSALVGVRSLTPQARAQGRTRPDPRRHLDPFGSVGAVIAGLGWAAPLEVPERARAGRVAAVVLAGPLVVLALGVGLLAAYGALAAGGDLSGGDLSGGGLLTSGLGLPPGSALLQRGTGLVGGLPFGEQALLLAGLSASYVGALQLVPLPPLPGGQVLFALAPQTLGWQKARYQLVDRNIGLVVLLAALVLPLGGTRLLPYVLDTVLDPLVRLVTGG